MLVKATYTFEFEPDTSDIDEKFVDKKGIARDLTEREIDYELKHNLISANAFNYEVIDDGDDHPLD